MPKTLIHCLYKIRKTEHKKDMTKTEMLNKISLLREVLEDSVLTSADLVAIRNEIGDLQDRIALLDFQEVEDIDFGHHSEWE